VPYFGVFPAQKIKFAEFSAQLCCVTSRTALVANTNTTTEPVCTLWLNPLRLLTVSLAYKHKNTQFRPFQLVHILIEAKQCSAASHICLYKPKHHNRVTMRVHWEAQPKTGSKQFRTLIYRTASKHLSCFNGLPVLIVLNLTRIRNAK
jgi:hypothetical protein